MVIPVRTIYSFDPHRPHLWSTEDSLKTDMGISGDAHEDTHDSELGFSNMMVLSDIPGSDPEKEDPEEGEYEPGRLHLIGLGLYTQLFTFRSIYFTGRLRHGGTAPLAPVGKPAQPWAYRCVIITYPSGAYVSGLIRQAFATLPFRDEVLYLSPEMTGVSCVVYTVILAPILSQHRSQDYRNVSHTDRANMAADGEALMDPVSHFNWFCRALLLFNRSLLHQLPTAYQIEVDPTLFLNSMTFREDDSRQTPLPWLLAPDLAVHQPDRNVVIDEIGAEGASCFDGYTIYGTSTVIFTDGPRLLPQS